MSVSVAVLYIYRITSSRKAATFEAPVAIIRSVPAYQARRTGESVLQTANCDCVRLAS